MGSRLQTQLQPLQEHLCRRGTTPPQTDGQTEVERREEEGVCAHTKEGAGLSETTTAKDEISDENVSFLVEGEKVCMFVCTCGGGGGLGLAQTQVVSMATL